MNTVATEARLSLGHEPPAGQSRAASLRQPALDGLRGLAILATMLLHYELRAWPYRSGIFFPSWLVIEHGWLGVELFFVLSGFLITGILFDAKRHSHYWRNYYARRTLRIFPLYYLALAIVFLVLPRPAARRWARRPFPRARSSGSGRTRRTFSSRSRATPHPLRTRLISGRSRSRSNSISSGLWWCSSAAGGICSASHSLPSLLSLALRASRCFGGPATSCTAGMLAPSHLDGLALGAFAATLTRGPRTAESLPCSGHAAAGGVDRSLARVGAHTGPSQHRRLRRRNDRPLVLVGLLRLPRARRRDIAPHGPHAAPLAWRPLQAIGRLCYGMYVWHYMLLSR